MTGFEMVLQQLILTLEGIIHGLCYNRMLKAANPDQPAWARVLCFWLVYPLILVPTWILQVRVPGYINLIAAFALCQILLYFFYQESLRTRIFAFVLLFLMQVAAELLLSGLYVVVQQHDTVNVLEVQMIPILLFAQVLDWILEYAACSAWVLLRRRRNPQAINKAASLTALIVPLLCLLYLSLGTASLQGSFIDAYLTAVGVSLVTLCAFLAYFFLFQSSWKKENQLEWENLQRIRTSQKNFFRLLEEQERKASFFRHDQLNILGSISQLLQEGQRLEAEELLAQVLERNAPTLPETAESAAFVKSSESGKSAAVMTVCEGGREA